MNQPNNIQTNSSTSVPCTETGVTSTSKTGEKTSSTIVFPKRAKTEDFLTFLCLRGTRCQSDLINFLVLNTCVHLYLNTRETSTNFIYPQSKQKCTLVKKACKLIIYTRKTVLNLNSNCKPQLAKEIYMVNWKNIKQMNTSW